MLVGSALVFGSAVGPTLAGLVVEPLGYRGMFGLLAGLGAVATLVLAAGVPETVGTHKEGPVSRPMAVVSDLSDNP